jgi:hypothetical protein
MMPAIAPPANGDAEITVNADEHSRLLLLLLHERQLNQHAARKAHAIARGAIITCAIVVRRYVLW